MESKKLELQVGEIDKDENCVLVWGRADSVSAKSNFLLSTNPDLDKYNLRFYNNKPNGSILNILFFRNCIPALTILVRKDTLLNIGGFKQSHGLPLVDLPTLFELSLKGNFIFIQDVLGVWNHYSEQVTKTHTFKMYEGFYKFKKISIQK
ncbi:MAG: hypothetical protein IPP49_06470 [Saprospiraceae bacterium]|nr:hypothetical protein [Saprospiraceae bacterium]